MNDEPLPWLEGSFLWGDIVGTRVRDGTVTGWVTRNGYVYLIGAFERRDDTRIYAFQDIPDWKSMTRAPALDGSPT